ncbi:unnamed protein product, partial [Rangifer tarandus platyrhynchus]
QFWDAIKHAPQADLEEEICHDLTESQEFGDASEHAPQADLEEETCHDLTESQEFGDVSEHAPQADLEEATCHDLTEEFWDASEHGKYSGINTLLRYNPSDKAGVF